MSKDRDWDGEANPWTVKGIERRYQSDWFTVDDYDTVNPGGGSSIYGVIRPRRAAVGVLPLEPDGAVHLVGQWRFPLGRYSWEIPEGGADPGEDLEACARRELAEESGFTAGKLEKILEFDVSNSLTDEQATLYLATDLTPGLAHPEEVEALKSLTAPFAEVLARVVDGRIRDSLTVAAVLRAHHMAVTGSLPPDLARAILGKPRDER